MNSPLRPPPAPPGYRIEGPLGAGAMGIVSLAVQLQLSREVALKQVSPGAELSDAVLARFQREAEVMSRVSHPHLVKVIDVGLSREHPYIAMELVRGETLDHAGRRVPVELRRVADRLFEQIAGAVSALHVAGLVHRDLKPSNIMYTVDGDAMVMDLGLVKDSDGERLTRTGVLLGTPQYLAPEVLTGQPATPASDVWALGCLYYFLYASAHLFQSLAYPELVKVICAAQVPDLDVACPDLPPHGRAFLAKLIQRDPDQRPRTAGRALELFRRLAAEARGERRPSASVPRMITAPGSRGGGVTAGARGSRTRRALVAAALAGSLSALCIVLGLAWARGWLARRTHGTQVAAVARFPAIAGWPRHRALAVSATGLPPGARVQVRAGDEPVRELPVSPAGPLTFDLLPPCTPLTITAIGQNGEALAEPLTTTTPDLVPVAQFRMHPTEDRLRVAFSRITSAPLDVELRRPDGNPVQIDHLPEGQGVYAHDFTGLQPEHAYTLSVRGPAGWGGVEPRQFTTWTLATAAKHVSLLRDAGRRPDDAGPLVSACSTHEPDYRGAEVVCRVMRNADGLGVRSLETSIIIEEAALLAFGLADRSLCDLLATLVEGMDSTNYRAVRRVLNALAASAHPRFPELVDRYLKIDPNWAIEALAIAGGRDSAVRLATALESSDRPFDVPLAATTMARADPGYARECAARWLAQPRRGNLDRALPYLLGTLGGKQDLAMLRRLLAEGRCSPGAIAHQLMHPSPMAAEITLDRLRVGPELAFIYAAARQRLRDAAPLLAPVVVGNRDPRVRRMAAWALGCIGRTQDAPVLMAALGDPIRDVADVAAWALGQMRHAPAAAALEKRALGDDDRRGAAAWALVRLERRSALPQLRDLAVKLDGRLGAADVGRRAVVQYAIRELEAPRKTGERPRTLALLPMIPYQPSETVAYTGELLDQIPRGSWGLEGDAHLTSVGVRRSLVSALEGETLVMVLGPSKQVLDHDVELGACAFQGTIAAQLGVLPFDAAVGLALVEFRR